MKFLEGLIIGLVLGTAFGFVICYIITASSWGSYGEDMYDQMD